jgi:hypothetical protein
VLRYYNSSKEDTEDDDSLNTSSDEFLDSVNMNEAVAKEKFQLYLQNNEARVLKKITDWLSNDI